METGRGGEPKKYYSFCEGDAVLVSIKVKMLFSDIRDYAAIFETFHIIIFRLLPCENYCVGKIKTDLFFSRQFNFD